MPNPYCSIQDCKNHGDSIFCERCLQWALSYGDACPSAIIAERLLNERQFVFSDLRLATTNDVEIDVRAQLTPDGEWLLHTGDASYDTDHRGYWGVGVLGGDTDIQELARDLISEALESAETEAGECTA